jgi:alpha-L-rhamnosidase
LVSDTQTALSLALCFDFYDDQTQLEAAGARLEQLVRLAKFRVATGFAGTPIILHALTITGREQVAYRMLQEKQMPSWLYPIAMGATTIWERWDSMLPDGSINPGEMTSFNHFSLGAIADWMHSIVGGIHPREPGWRVFSVAPRPGGTIRHATVTFESAYGRIECSWSLKSFSDNADQFEMDVIVPPNSEAWIKLPNKPLRALEGYTVVGSGSHFFSCVLPMQEWPLTAMKTWTYEEDDGDVA